VLFAFLATLVFLFVAAWLDIYTTHRVIVTGAGVEGNTWLVGTKPTIARMLLKELLQSGVLIAVAVLGVIYNTPIASAGMSGMVVFGVKHLTGWRAGVRLLKH
jgi:hypothetical protein